MSEERDEDSRPTAESFRDFVRGLTWREWAVFAIGLPGIALMLIIFIYFAVTGTPLFVGPPSP